MNRSFLTDMHAAVSHHFDNLVHTVGTLADWLLNKKQLAPVPVAVKRRVIR